MYIVMYKTRGVSFGVGLVGWLMNAHDGMPEFPNTKDTHNLVVRPNCMYSDRLLSNLHL